MSIPKSASVSIETALRESELDIKTHRLSYKDGKYNHSHIKLGLLYDEFGRRETICIKRDWFKRWLSSFEYYFIRQEQLALKCNLEPVKHIDLQEVNNGYIFDVFTPKMCNILYNLYDGKDPTDVLYCYNKIFNNPADTPWPDNEFYKNELTGLLSTMLSDNYYKENIKCTYEFEFDKLNEFENFIEMRFGRKIKIEKMNSVQKKPNKIIINEELKCFVWEMFEKRFEKRNSLL